MDARFFSRLHKIEEILSKTLPPKANAEWQQLSFGALDDCVQQEHLGQLIAPNYNLISLGGKRWRPLLLVLCAELAAEAKCNCAASTEVAYRLTPLVELSHTSSLIMDDIEDSADMRRGKPAAHITYGLDAALNAGSWLGYEATICIDDLNLPAELKNTFYSLYLLELRRLHLGQAMDILWHRNPALIPSVEEYTAMVRNKTGTLARMAVKIGILAGGGTAEEAERAGKIAEDIGVGFQIIDDVTNLTTGNPGKKRGDDIVEGKKSLPVLLHLQDHPNAQQKLGSLFETARAEGINSPAVEAAIALLSTSDAIEKARLQGNELVETKSRELAALYGTDGEPSQLIIELFATMLKK
ncbi:MAG: polyprenyl synthetase family protein [Treponema sp.]|nr:polyprenyl synthetase family protein [Treponema sp.]